MRESVEGRFQPPLLDPTLGPLRVNTSMNGTLPYRSNVRFWLEGDIRRNTLRGLVSARKRTLANRISETARFTSAYRSEADIARRLRQCLLVMLWTAPPPASQCAMEVV